MQDKRKGLAELLEPGNHIPAGWARAESWDPFRQPLPVAAGPALPSRRFICHPGDRWQSGGCRSGDVTLREPRSSLPADKGRGSRYLCQVTNNPASSRRCKRHHIRVCSWERHKRGCCEHRCRCRGARAGCRWGSWVLIGKRENRVWERKQSEVCTCGGVWLVQNERCQRYKSA